MWAQPKYPLPLALTFTQQRARQILQADWHHVNPIAQTAVSEPVNRNFIQRTEKKPEEKREGERSTETSETAMVVGTLEVCNDARI